MNRRLVFLCAAALLAVHLHSFAADWPQWRGLNRDGKSQETDLLERWPEAGLTPVWVAEGLGEGYTSVAVADGTLYTSGMVAEEGTGVLFAFDLAGAPKWRSPYGPEWTEGAYPGTRSTPTVDKDRVFIMSGHGRVLSFDARTGDESWSKDVATDFGGTPPVMGFAESLLVVDDKVICTPGGEDASLAALDKTNGKTIWTTKGFSEQSAYCSPILVERGGTRLIITITARSVVGIEAETGTKLWSHPQDPGAEDPNHAITPVYENGCIYATSGHGEGGQLLRLSPDGQSVTQVWTDSVLNALHGGVLAVDGHLYGASTKARWICLALDSGEVMYEERGVGRGSVAYAGGMLYCYGEKGTLALVPASPAGYKIASSFKVPHGEGQHWAHPVIAGGRLYIRHGDALMAYPIAK